ncbi:hypothetical protein ACN6K5_001345 [Streptomyces violaceoruber]|uniref:hypothetical protein n=1 Tax=Streptomyces violaceoruber group TaxID=2867121 RepID=UPI0033FAD5FE
MSITEYDPWERDIVAYDSRKVQQVQVREHIDGIDLVETVTVRPLRVWEKTVDGLVELHGEDAQQAMTDFWAQGDNAEQENDR